VKRTVALLVALGALPAVAAAPAGAASRVAIREVDPGFVAAAFSGDALVLARRTAADRMVVELRAPGRAPVVLAQTARRRFWRGAAVAASPQAVAVSLYGGDGREDPGRVLVGPPAGPLREVARCASLVASPPVAVDGTRVAWAEGGCITGEPGSVGPSAIAIGDVDPAVSVLRAAAEGERVPIGLALGPGGAVAGLLRPAFVSEFAGELRRVEGEALGPVLAGRPAEAVEPFGVLPGGVTVATRSVPLDDFFYERDESSRGCEIKLLAVAAPEAGSGQRRLRLGRCPAAIGGEYSNRAAFFYVSPTDAQSVAVAAADRVVVRTFARRRPPDYEPLFDPATTAVELRSATAGGSDLRVIVRGSEHRGPQDLVGGSGRVGWLQPRCVGGLQLRALDTAAPAGGPERIRDCRADLLTRRAKLRRGAIRVRIRCPRGCKGRLVDRSVCSGETSRQFRFGRGVHTVRLRLTRRARRVGHAVLRLRVESGAERRRTVRVVRRAG
jgi:hypothetical protein